MASVLDLVKHYQHAIEKYPNDEQKILKCIDKLFNLQVTVQHLQDTGVGRTVNALRKEPGEVGQAARALVNKWKLMVAAEESDQETDHNESANHNGYGNGKDSDDNTKYSNQTREERSSNSSRRNEKNNCGEMNGNYSGSKRKYQSSEEEEPDIKKSKGADRNSYDSYKKTNVKVKPEPKTESESDESEHSNSDDSESEMSESTVEEVKVKQEMKSEYHHKSSKHSSSRNENNKKESSSKHESKSSKHSSTGSRKERHSSEKSSSKESTHSSQKREKETSSEKKHKSDHKEKDKQQKEKSKSSKHSSSDRHKSSSQTESSSDKHKNQNERHSDKADKHRSSSHSHKSEKDKHKSSSEKEISSEKHNSKDHFSSSKEKSSSSSREKSNKDKGSSSKEKSDSHKSEKKHSSSSSSDKNKSKDKTKDKVEDKNDNRSKQKSSSSSHKSSKPTSNKSTEDIPKKKNPVSHSEDSDDGIDCGSGASFAEALGMISPAKPKKKPGSLKESYSPGNTDLSPAALLAPSAKLAPLPTLEISALPEISPNYKPRPPPKLMPNFTDEEAMSAVISSKNQRTKVYSGNKVMGRIPSLYEMCVHILQEHIDALEYTGGVPYEILKPVIDKATPQQLFLLEHYNPYLMEDTDHLWQKFCEKHFRKQQRQEMETWREMYMRCQEEQEHRLKSLTENIKIAQEAKKAPIKQTKMAYVDTVVKPPRNIARKQALHGTAHAASASPAARVAALAAAPNILRGAARPTPAAPVSASFKPKKAPLMAKALQFMRGRKR